MKTSTPLSKAELARRDQQLTAAASQLKAQFVGIHAQIDQLIEHIRPWYLLPGQQERPRIVNLWGMTGVGKTALVESLIDLLELRHRYFPIDLGNSFNRGGYLEDNLDNAHFNDDRPAFLFLDEFQKARTIDKDGDEIYDHNRYLWNLLDHGQIAILDRARHIETLQDILRQFEMGLAMGVKVENGLVVTAKETFRKVCLQKYSRHHSDEEDEPLPFIEEDLVEALWECDKRRFPTRLHVRQILMALDGPGSLAFIQEILNQIKVPRIVDCRQDLVLIAGNLDQAYRYTNATDPDQEADSLRRANQEIGIPRIKDALLKRFRPEQVARLGNNHVIYPTFSNETFEELIRRQLRKLSERFENLSGVPLRFAQPVEKLIYKEGVFPSQGTRPLFTTIDSLAGSRLGNWQLQILQLDQSCQAVDVQLNNHQLQVQFLDIQGKVLSELFHSLHLPLKKARKPRRDDKQALTAVHEAGHAVLSCALLGAVPLKIVSQSTDENDCDGYVQLGFGGDKIVSKPYLLRKVAMLLGGLAAESLIFGEEHVTLGSNSDLQEATRWLFHAYRKSGFAHTWAFYGKGLLGTPYLSWQEKYIDKAILATIEEAKSLAFDTLRFEMPFLLALSHALANRQQLSQSQIEKIRKAHMQGKLETPLLAYRQHLMRQTSPGKLLL
ncbi:MAG: hypothetical protein C0424_09430 [Sphingobacteriaceae bacterium]|nr:hypothetical protein [Sphingobacteriaceae bacterium]